MSTVFTNVASPKHVFPDHPESPDRFSLLLPRLDSFGAQKLDVTPAAKDEIARVHLPGLIESLEEICRQGPAIIDPAPTFVTRTSFEDALLAAGGTLVCTRAVLTGDAKNAFALIRPPGHHASASSAWGFCYFNNMAITLERLKAKGKINKAFLLDFDLHFGDGNVNILSSKGYVTILNPDSSSRLEYLKNVEKALARTDADLIAVSAGFDNHEEDWGGLLKTEDYTRMGRLVRETALRNKGGCFGILEGGYNHAVLGKNVKAFINGLQAP